MISIVLEEEIEVVWKVIYHQHHNHHGRLILTGVGDALTVHSVDRDWGKGTPGGGHGINKTTEMVCDQCGQCAV